MSRWPNRPNSSPSRGRSWSAERAKLAAPQNLAAGLEIGHSRLPNPAAIADTNLARIAVNPTGNCSQARMSRFGRQLFSHFVIDPAKPDRQQEFVGLHTALLRKHLSLAAARRVARKPDLGPATS